MAYSFWETLYFYMQYCSACLFFHRLIPVGFHCIAWCTVFHFKLWLLKRFRPGSAIWCSSAQHQVCATSPHTVMFYRFLWSYNIILAELLCSVGKLKPVLQNSVGLTPTSFNLGFLYFTPSNVLGWILHEYLHASHSRCTQAEAPCWYKRLGLFWTASVLEIFLPLIYRDVCSN